MDMKLLTLALLMVSSLALGAPGVHELDDPELPSVAWLIIGLLHAVPPIYASKFNNKLVVLLTGLATAVFAVAVGTPAYAVVDLFFAGIGLWFAISVLNNTPEARQAKMKRERAEFTKGFEDGWNTAERETRERREKVRRDLAEKYHLNQTE